jgi:hypothetical protein
MNPMITTPFMSPEQLQKTVCTFSAFGECVHLLALSALWFQHSQMMDFHSSCVFSMKKEDKSVDYEFQGTSQLTLWRQGQTPCDQLCDGLQGNK